MNRIENPNTYVLPEDLARHMDLVSSHNEQMRAILHALESAQQQPTLFVFRAFIVPGTTSQRMTAANRGIVKMVHNPTAAQITVTLSLNGNIETAILVLDVPTHASMGILLPFSAPLYVHTGNGAIVAGEIMA